MPSFDDDPFVDDPSGRKDVCAELTYTKTVGRDGQTPIQIVVCKVSESRLQFSCLEFRISIFPFHRTFISGNSLVLEPLLSLCQQLVLF